MNQSIINSVINPYCYTIQIVANKINTNLAIKRLLIRLIPNRSVNHPDYAFSHWLLSSNP